MKKGMILILLLFIPLAYAVEYLTLPSIYGLDRVINNDNLSGNITADFLFGNLSWSYLYDYPLACPSDYALTALGDSVICTLVDDMVTDDYWNRTAPYTYLANINDNVGIGTSTPSEKLEVNGNATILEHLAVGAGVEITPTSYLSVLNELLVGSWLIGGSKIRINGDDGLIEVDSAVASDYLSIKGGTKGGIRLENNADGNVSFFANSSVGEVNTVKIHGYPACCEPVVLKMNALPYEWFGIFADLKKISFEDNALRTSGDVNFTGNAYLNNTLNVVNGLVGIGTSTPTQKLHVVGGINATQNSTIAGLKIEKLPNGHVRLSVG